MNIPLKFIRFWIVSFSKWEFSNSLLYLPFTGFENSKATKCCFTLLVLRLHLTVSLYNDQTNNSKAITKYTSTRYHNYSHNLYTVLQSFTLIINFTGCTYTITECFPRNRGAGSTDPVEILLASSMYVVVYAPVLKSLTITSLTKYIAYRKSNKG